MTQPRDQAAQFVATLTPAELSEFLQAARPDESPKRTVTSVIAQRAAARTQRVSGGMR